LHAAAERVFAVIRPHIEPLANAFREPHHLPRPATLLVQACAYITRHAKRARPQLTARRRMCPST
jgi:hypothetical protein